MRSLKIVSCAALLLLSILPVEAKTNYSYIANNSDNTVSVIDTRNNAVVKTVPVGSHPFAVAVNQAGTFAYVTNSGSNTVSVIKTSNNTVVATITLTGQSGPMYIALTPNGKTAYVSCGNTNSVAVINTAAKTFKTIAVENPVGLAVAPNGAFVYVVSSSAGNVLVISTLTNAVVATIPVGTDIPVAVAISPDGYTAYVTNYNANTVSVVRTDNSTVANTINLSSGPFQEAISPDGHWLYVANYNAGGGNLVTAIDTSTQTITSTIVVGTGPGQVSFSQDGSLAYVANFTTNNVSVINTQSRTVVNTISVGNGPTGAGVMGTMKVTTVAGGYVGDGGAATYAALSAPFNTVQDKKGNYYVTDRLVHRIRKITPTGVITTFAGTGICGYNGDNIKAKSAMLCLPAGLAFDAAGNLYVADDGNQRVRKIDTKGKITTVAGTGVWDYSGDGGPATSAALRDPWTIAFDPAGNLYFAEVSNHIVRKVNASGTISTYAGTGVAGFSGDGGPAAAATLNRPRGIGFDSLENLYIADQVNQRVRIVTAAGTINTFAGTGQGGCNGDGGLATDARIGGPRGITIDNGVLYVGTAGCARVRSVDLTSNIISTFAGSTGGYDGDNNPPLSSRFSLPNHTLFDAGGNVLIDDPSNGRVRKLSGGLINTFAGGYLGDGNLATKAALVNPEGLAIDKSGNLYIADWTGNRVRKVSGGKISTIAGTGVDGYSGDGGPATAALLSGPQGVAVDSTGNVFIADTNNGVIRKVDTTGTISTFAADPYFWELHQMAVDSADNLYVADRLTSVIFKITPAGEVSIVAGVPFTYGYNGDNIPATEAWLNSPYGVAVDKHGNVLIPDSSNSRVRQVNAEGTISTITGDGNCNSTGDGGSAAAAELCSPWSIAVSSSDTIYIVDTSYLRIRKISDGIITAFAGSEAWFNGDGLWPLLTAFTGPVAVAVDSKGTVYVLDNVDHRVRKIQ